MRKVSKNRTDEDVTSSTDGSGSVVNEESTNAGHSIEEAEKESDPKTGDAEDSGNGLSEIEKEKDDSSKKGRGKVVRPKRESAGKAKKITEKEEENEEEEEYEVEKIIDSKKIRGKVHYLIRWKGYSADEDTWEPADTLSCPDLINKFNEEKENSEDKNDEPQKKSDKRKSITKAKSPRKKAKNKELDSEKGDEAAEYEKENSEDKNYEPQKKTNKRKSKTKAKSSPKKAKNNEWDSEKADETAEYEVERILEVHHKKSGKREFLIHWKGWSSKFDSWEPESNLNCPELIKKFMEKVDAARSSDSRSLRVAPESTNRFTLQDPTSGRRLSKRQNQRQRVRYDNAE